MHARSILIHLLLDMGKPGEAAAVLQQMVQDTRVRPPVDDPLLAGMMAQVVLALLASGQYAEAEPLARECLAIREKKPPGDWRTFSTRSLVGDCLLGQQKYAEAEPLLLSGYQGLKEREASIPQFGKPRVQEALQRLVRLYGATSQTNQMAKWKMELEEFDRTQTNRTAANPATKP
jgi:hypothetical protein